MVLTMVIIQSTINMFIPAQLAEEAKQSAWIVPLIASVAGVITLWVIIQLGKRFPRSPLPIYSQVILGKFFGKALNIGYFFIFWFGCILITREFVEYVSITLLPGTPPLVLSFAFILVGVYAASKRLEVIARMSEFVLPLLLVAFSVVLFLGWFKVDLDRLLPFLEEGIVPVLKVSRIPAAWFGEIIFLAFIYPQINKPKEIFKKGLWGILVSAGQMLIMTFLTVATFGPYLTSTMTFPVWSFARFLEFGRYVQRLESLLSLLWITSLVIKISLFLYVASETLIQAVKVQYNTVLFPLGAVTALGALYISNNTRGFMDLLLYLWPISGLVSEIGIPSLLLIIAILRGKKEQQLNER